MMEESSTILGQEEQAIQSGPVFAGPGANHDQTPFKLKRLSSSQYDFVQKAKKYAMEQNIKTVLVKQTIAHQQQQMQSMQNALQKQQAWSLMCRIYVGSINFEIKEDTVQQAFLPFGPMRSFHLAYDPMANKHKGFSFIEYETPEAASLALEQMNGVILGGRNIKVGRPSNMPQAQAIIENYLLEAQSYHRIYVSSIHPELNETDLKSVFEAFGRVLSCKLARDSNRSGKHKGYAFIQFDNPQSAYDAVSAMNLFDLGGQYIRVGKAVTPPNVDLGSTSAAPMPTATAVAAAAITARITAQDAVSQSQVIISLPVVTGSANAVQPGVPGVSLPVTLVPPVSDGITDLTTPSVVTLPDVVLGTMPATKTAQSETPPALSVGQIDENLAEKQEKESRVIILSNMVGEDDVDDDLQDEVREECNNYGDVKHVIVHKEQRLHEEYFDDKEDEEYDAGKIFVEFSDYSASEKAISALNGRFFDGRQVIAEFYSEDLFRKKFFNE